MIKYPPPNFKHPSASLLFNLSGAILNPHLLWYECKWLILVSSDQTTFFQSSRVQCWCLIAKSNLSFLWCGISLARPFPLNHSLHPSILQAISNCLCRDRLVDNIPESFGDLDCIFSSPWANKVNCKTDVSLWKLCCVTTWGLLKTGTMFGVDLEMVALETPVWDETGNQKCQNQGVKGYGVCNILHFTKFLTVHQKNLNQIFIINGVLSDRYEGYSKDVVA